LAEESLTQLNFTVSYEKKTVCVYTGFVYLTHCSEARRGQAMFQCVGYMSQSPQCLRDMDLQSLQLLRDSVMSLADAVSWEKMLERELKPFVV